MHAIIALWEVLGGAGLLTWKQTWNLELMSHSRKSVRSSIIFYIYGVMAAPVVVNEVLNFYRDDELFGAKSQLCQVAMNRGSAIDGWPKYVNSKGTPINRRGEGVVKRSADAHDVVSMLAVLDVNGVVLPTYASVDLSRVPSSILPTAVGNTGSLMGDVVKSLKVIAKWLDVLENQQPGSFIEAVDLKTGQQGDMQTCLPQPSTSVEHLSVPI